MIYNTLTRLEYKQDYGEFLKFKATVRLCARRESRDQQIPEFGFKDVLKTTEARLLLAIAALNGNNVVMTVTKQAYLHCYMGDDIRPPEAA